MKQNYVETVDIIKHNREAWIKESEKGFYEDTAGGDLLDLHINTMIATKAIKL